MTQKQSVEPRTVSMYPADWMKVERIANTSGVRSLSAALRLIISEFERMKNEKTEDQHGQRVTVA